MKMIKKMIPFIMVAIMIGMIGYVCPNHMAMAEETEDQWGQDIDNPWLELLTKEKNTTSTEATTANKDTTTTATEQTSSGQVEPSTEKSSSQTTVTVAKVKIIKVAAKKKSLKRVKITIAKVKGANGYQVRVYRKKADAKKNVKAICKKTIKKNTKKIVFKNKKLKNKKKLFIRVRAYKLDANGKKVFGEWSLIKKVKIKK